ncbi:RdgB/HAM1 family non-canonical purine NTP pyrophosphatase [Entomospira entomophila]|uniref:dITP/XTP pyrophosphatase n=1 Tax=Entomospira entomophila TaxID=2719988 RepID=A0A968KVK1_9SPIO|nr:RdgB/HAM1 family non-canonical purine NTP pyrophosphatase [Entomospira entomophilus]NIZ39930.1 RdgB/HAM1 family non-canonical purine NTP pyrophosphatase [Entomospira entomophilus]WDI35491.1 RdgB/HAM1 family non-canonical purine NTP pyrophosphatase [Entomospira entomophilus]
MIDRKEIVLASNNKHKQEEFSNYFQQRVLLPEDLGIDFFAQEDSDTFIGNALIKAQSLYNRIHRPVLSDDSGLVISALPDILGVKSARFLPQLSQAEKNIEILRLMQHQQQRQAYFVCALVLYSGREEFVSVQDIWEGTISTKVMGNFGFGYDPIFLLNDGRCAAELVPQEKMRVSHRGKALSKLHKWMIREE